jgi:hypothetical protein
MALKAIRITMFHGIVYPGKGSELSCAREKVRLCPQMVLSQQVIPYLLMCLRIERECVYGRRRVSVDSCSPHNGFVHIWVSLYSCMACVFVCWCVCVRFVLCAFKYENRYAASAQ